jgi:hypothetical protein
MRKLALGAVMFALLAAVACGNSSFSGTDVAPGTDGGGGGGGDGGPGGGSDSGDPLMTGTDGGTKPADAGSGGGMGQAEGGAPPSGIFVSTSLGHDDTGDGSMANPYKTLMKAIGVAASLKKVVNACNETYAENLVVADGVSLYANYDCTKGWMQSTTNGVLNAPASPAVVTDPAKPVVTGTTIGHLDINAPVSPNADRSSIGIVAVNSHGLEFANLTVTTQAAVSAPDQVEPTQLVNDGTVDGAANGTAGTNTCGGSGKPGGTGGPGGTTTDTCTAVTAVNPKHVTTYSNVKATQGNYTVANFGTNGSSATSGTFSSDKNTGFFIPGNGIGGVNGKGGLGADGVNSATTPIDDINNGSVAGGKTVWSCMCEAGGGCTQGGGNATSMSTAPGSGGGAGGCPGLAGSPGGGGGASIGVLMFGAPLTLSTVSYTIGNGGNGGKGTQGAAPTNGGTGGAGGTPGTAAGYSGSGAGGPCLAVAYDNVSGPPITNKGGALPGTTTLGSAGKGVAAFGTVPASGDGAKSDLYAIP